ncbi:MAG TPA: CapA family protein [Acidimicrobiia bacterium]|nr:CapA family protein [Acidimicrobiia bacterium]
MRLSVVTRALLVLAGGLLLGTAAFVASDGLAPSEAAALSTSTTEAPTTSTTTASTTTTTTTLPTTTTTTLPPKGALVIHATGDVNTDTSYIPALVENGHAHAWSGLDGLFQEDDLTVINLECTPSDLGTPLPKEFVFRCDVDSLPVMQEAGIDVANLANNHSADYGKEALVDGRAQLESALIAPVGAGADRDEAYTPAVFEIDGWTVAVLGFGGVVPTSDWLATDDSPGMADGDSAESMAAAVRAADEMADLVIVTVHWGFELETEPDEGDRARAEAMIEAGADMIFGHHPHRLQPLEVVDGVPVAWSLGNFVWPNFSVPGSTTAVARVVVAPDGSMESCLIPAFITSPGRPELTGDPGC